jgi:type I restriction enzyme R subunit
MTEFKQIIGRGTRVNEAFGKQFFTIMDFRNVTDLFADKDFDGEPVMIKVVENVDDETELDDDVIDGGNEPPIDTEPETKPEPPITEIPVIIGGGEITEEPRVKVYVAGVEVTLLSERVQYLDENGKLITGSLTDYTRRSLLKEFTSLDNFLTRWNSSEKKKALIDELEQQGIILENLREDVKKDLDIFDLICHVAWDKPALTRRERANDVRKRDYFTQYSEQAQKVLRALLDKYADVGIEHIENLGLLSVDPFSDIGTPIEIVKLFGGKEKYLAAVKQLETEIYNMAA